MSYKIQIVKNGSVKNEFESITACIDFFDEKYPNHKWTRYEISRHAKENIPIADGIYFKIIDNRTHDEMRKTTMDFRMRWCKAKGTETKLKYIKLFIEQVHTMIDDASNFRQSICKIKPITRTGTGMAYAYYQKEIKDFNSKLTAIKALFKKRRNWKKIPVAKRDYYLYGQAITISDKETILIVPNRKTVQKIKAGAIKRPANNGNFLKSITKMNYSAR